MMPRKNYQNFVVVTQGLEYAENTPQFELYTKKNGLSMLSIVKNRKKLVYFTGKKLNFELFLAGIGNVQMLIGKGGDATASGGAGQEAQLHQIGLVNIF